MNTWSIMATKTQSLYIHPLEKKLSTLQIVKGMYKSMNKTTINDFPSNTDEINKLSNRKHALDYLELKGNNKIRSKKEYCKTHKISPGTLNRGLATLGVETRPKREYSKAEDSLSTEKQTLPRSKGIKGDQRDLYEHSDDKF